MARSQASIWQLEPHTLAKHAIFRRYLQAWLPIMTRRNNRVVVIDGFAGPGRYAGGEEGSPMIALRAALEHSHPITAELVFLFIEADDERKANLDREIAELSVPSNVRIMVHCGTFDETVSVLLNEVEDAGRRLAPTFALVDPFGWSQTPFFLIRPLLANPKTEVLINIMYEEINRFLALPQSAPTLDRLFGSPDWRRVCLIQAPVLRRQRIRPSQRRPPPLLALGAPDATTSSTRCCV